jgi:hypothetical protein
MAGAHPSSGHGHGDAHGGAHTHPAPSVPKTVRDEAADTPLWVPALGLALFALLGLYVVTKIALRADADAAAAAAAAEAAPREAEGGAEDRGAGD